MKITEVPAGLPPPPAPRPLNKTGLAVSIILLAAVAALIFFFNPLSFLSLKSPLAPLETATMTPLPAEQVNSGDARNTILAQVSKLNIPTVQKSEEGTLADLPSEFKQFVLPDGRDLKIEKVDYGNHLSGFSVAYKYSNKPFKNTYFDFLAAVDRTMEQRLAAGRSFFVYAFIEMASKEYSARFSLQRDSEQNSEFDVKLDIIKTVPPEN